MRNLTSVMVLTTLCVCWSAHGTVADDKQATKVAATTQGDPEAKTADRYEVPSEVSEILVFLKRIRAFRPTTSAELLEHRQKALGAIKRGAERILKLEKDPDSEAAKTAKGLLLKLEIQDLSQASQKRQTELFEEVYRHLSRLKSLSADELALAHRTATHIERSGNGQLAAKAYETFGQMFFEQQDEALASYGKQMLGVSRRTNLLGNEMKVSGKTLSGDDFEWSDYRGKVVLVDFWATWCGPCVRELPNVRKLYDAYHKRGFEVVGISLDTDRQRLTTFVQQRELPWVTLFEDGDRGDHPVATYYGVMTIPTAILVDKEGKVVSLNARGEELSRQLEVLMGPSGAAAGD